MLLTKNLFDICLKTIFYKFIKLFKIKNIIKEQIYCLRLSKKQQIYFVFCILLLKLYYQNTKLIVSKDVIFIKKKLKTFLIINKDIINYNILFNKETFYCIKIIKF